MIETIEPASSAQASVDPREIEAELIGGLYRRTQPLIVANFGALVLLTIAFWSTADRIALLTWSLGLGSWTCLRFALATLYLRRPRAITEVRTWTLAFAVGSGVAGLLWGSSIVLVANLEADSAKLITAFVMAALSAAAICGYTNSLLAFTAFIVPALLPYGIKLVWLDGTAQPMIAAFVAFWGWLMWTMARHLNDGFRDGIALTLRNRNLVEVLVVARDAAEAASLAKTRFLANMSHELRTPLNAIIGYSELMAQKLLGPLGNARYEGYAHDIYQSGTRLLHVVGQVLDLSSLESGNRDLTEDVIDVGELVRGTVERIAPLAAEDRIAITVAAPADLPKLRGDIGKLRKVLRNLLTNAVKFTPADGRIAVTAEQADGELVLSVADTGVGIASADLERVTVPFARLQTHDHAQRERVLKREIEGTTSGLGLPLAKLLVEAHGGRFTLASEPGKGTIARIFLPAGRVIAEPPAPAQRAVA